MQDSRLWRRQYRSALAIAVAIVLLGGSSAVWAIITQLGEVDLVHDPVAVHVSQDELKALVAAGENRRAFEEAFELGDELFATPFNALDGGGANVGNGQRFTRVPRADLNGAGQWRAHTPFRVTGPNAQGCFECHEQPFEDGSGTAALNVHRDAFRTGVVGQFVERNTPHVFAPGAIQRLAEEMTDALAGDQRRLVQQACQSPFSQAVPLTAKGVSFGTLRARRTATSPCTVEFDTNDVRGVDFSPSVENPAAGPLLIVRPFQWKGSVGFLRDFNRGASHNELGMQAVEIVGDGVDGDADGVVDEMTIGDQTALAIYIAAPAAADEPARAQRSGCARTPAHPGSDRANPEGAPGLPGGGLCLVPQADPDHRSADLQRAEPERRLSGWRHVPGGTGHRAPRRGSGGAGRVRPDPRPAGQPHRAA